MGRKTRLAVRPVVAVVIGVLAAGLSLVAGTTQTYASPASTYGPYLIINDHSHMCPDVPGGDPTSGVKVQLWDCWGGPMQRWWLDYVGSDNAGSYFQVRNVATNKCLDVPGGDLTWGVKVQQWDCWADGQMQQWRLIQLDNNLVQLKNRMTNLCLDDTDGSLIRGTILQQWDCWGGAMQRWTLY